MLPSVQDADRIIVMEGGRISDIGTHDELLSRNEIYREIYTTQNKAGDQNGEDKTNTALPPRRADSARQKVCCGAC